ncbi:diacylglycerol kinase family protein [Streptomyces sp. NBC_01276]|uniref:diacylglycerol kinase family protein n=1 Tax=Streptomyces sp. NBC_01276 TaxID=2903808 RepID=UPI00352D2414
MMRRYGSTARGAWLLLFLPVQAALMVALGRFVTGPAARHWPLSEEAGAVRESGAHRDGATITLSKWLSVLAGTEVVIAVTLVCVIALLVLPRVAHRVEAMFLAVSVAAQSAVFVVVTAFVERPRPAVTQLDAAPPTSSFPSGHVGASVALYAGLAVIAALRMRGPWRWVATTLLLLIPPAVGLSRVHRGMHYPSDVAAGLLNGVVTLVITGFALLYGHTAAKGSGARPDVGTDAPSAGRSAPRPGPLPTAEPTPPPGDRPEPAPATGPVGRPVLVVRHPHGCPDELADRIRAVLRDHGHQEPDQRWITTSAARPCGELEPRIAAERPALVVVCGGDGTVRACAEVLAGTGIPLAVAPCGTGNLLARNLGLPTDPATALFESLTGDSFGIDVGRTGGDGLRPSRFTVMAGVGFDAAMVRDASPRLKSRMGWAAYVLSAVRHLGDPSVRLTVSIDGGRPLKRRARMAVIGNVGALQGGLPLLPGARPDSGRLEVVLFAPRGPSGWLAAAGHLTARLLGHRPPPPARTRGGHSEAGGALEYFSATRVDIRCATAQPRELDGDAVPDGTRLTAEIEPGALRVHLPRAPGAPHEPPRAAVTADRSR